METMNNNIQEQRVSSDNAKRLKEKGFDVKCNRYIDLEPNMAMAYDEKVHIYVPTQQLALDWIMVNFGVHIYTYCVTPYQDEEMPYPTIVWVSKVRSPTALESQIFINTDNGLAVNHFHTPEEAKEAAISFVLA